MRPLVIIESPYAGKVMQNIAYGRAAMLDCLERGEAPFASHLLYTQCLDDTRPNEREMGMRAGLDVAALANKTVVYLDRGISAGMSRGMDDAAKAGREVEFRRLPGWENNGWPARWTP